MSKKTEEKVEEDSEEEIMEDIDDSDDSEDSDDGAEAEIVEAPIEPEEEGVEESRKKEESEEDSWSPKTSLGKQVKAKEIVTVDQILDNGLVIFEKEIVEHLLPDHKTDLLLIGQSKGKFGGGQRRVFKQTQKKTREGNKPRFATYAVVGNSDGVVGIGYGKSKETVPAREKAIRNAKLNIFKVRRGCGSWECNCKEPHSIPFKVVGKCGSTQVEIMPAPKGTGLKVEKECQKMLSLAGIKDVWSKARGQTKTKTNLVIACEKALKKLMSTKVQSKYYQQLGVAETTTQSEEATAEEPVE